MTTPVSETPAAVPFLKWAGGKRQLLPAILPAILDRVPARCATYYEPFLGGGAVFFALAARRAFRRAVLTDLNAELIDAYLGIRDDVEGVIRRLARMKHDEGTFYRIRARDPAASSIPARAARLIYLNRTCYNGLYRVNSRGLFNVPFGRYKNPRILDRDNLRLVSRALQGVTIQVADFEEGVARAKPGDVVYFDPPYEPVSRTSSFTAYSKDGFGPGEQLRLAKLMRTLRDKGVYALLSNADVPATRALYRECSLESVLARRAINSRPDKRGAVPELLVRSLPQERTVFQSSSSPK